MASLDGIGVLLANTGTTSAPRTRETRAYLREFLSDPRVIDVPAALRYFLLYAFILPFRPRRSAEAYAKIWTKHGSPLLLAARACQRALEERFPGVAVAIGMRYGQPSIEDALDTLMQCKVDRILVVPLFPQYASASNGSVLEKVYRILATRWNVPAIAVVPPFHDEPAFLDAWKTVAAPVLAAFRPGHVLMSYHGLPERHVRKSDPTGHHCLLPGCCDRLAPDNRFCYRAQCMATSRELAARLGLSATAYSVSFQSRLGSDPWLKPATDEAIPELARQGVKRLAVMCPAFVADCLETLEEIGMRAKSSFLDAGGEAFELVPCLNAHPAWIEVLAGWVRRYADSQP